MPIVRRGEAVAHLTNPPGPTPYADRIQGVTTGWLRWQLMNDQTLRSMFVDDTCGVCTDSNWNVQQKHL